jgi:hypothetical protein
MSKSPDSLNIEADSYDYDFENDSLFVNREGVQLEASIDLGNVILDMGVDGTPVGFEILHASKIFKVSKSQIKNFHHITAEYLITEKTIEVKFTITVDVRNYRTPKIAISQGINDMDLPPAQISMVC